MSQARAERHCPVRGRAAGLGVQSGQAALMMLAIVGAILAGAVLLFAFGNALGGKGRLQRAADLAAISAAQVMRDLYPRLFEPPFIEPDVPNPRHLEYAEYRELAIAAAIRGGRRNGVVVRPGDVTFQASGFAPSRVTVQVRDEARVSPAASGGDAIARIPVRARATAELIADAGGGLPGHASGGGYDGPLAHRQGKPMRPDVALAFDRLAAAARREAGVFISISSGYRSDAEQAALFAAHPDPKWVAPPGESLHRYATELDLGPPAAYGWLAANAERFGFVQRYAGKLGTRGSH
jgi:D-alanyl-D-alanine carboxypeptidase/Putative Flp pilus-assembly TadE/G-like